MAARAAPPWGPASRRRISSARSAADGLPNETAGDVWRPPINLSLEGGINMAGNFLVIAKV